MRRSVRPGTMKTLLRLCFLCDVLEYRAARKVRDTQRALDPYRPLWRWLLRELVKDFRDLARYGLSPKPKR